MFTISDIVSDVDRGCAVNNLNENRFSYRVIFFVNEKEKGSKHYIDTSYSDLRKSLENIIRENLSLENSVVIAQTTIRKDGICISLQSRSYPFSLSGYFRQIEGESKYSNGKRNIMYGRCSRQYGGG